MLNIENTEKILLERLKEKSPLIQVLLGPRQVGKTTLLLKIEKKLKDKVLYFTADESFNLSSSWLIEKWNLALEKGKNTILVIDEIQKLENWSETVKLLWDRQKRSKNSSPKLVLSGSASLHIQKGLSESLTGRFELIRVYHWGHEETKKVFKLSLEVFIKHGGYPGSMKLLKDPSRFNHYIMNSIIDTVISKDILHFNKVKSPSLFRQTFELLSCYPAQVISYNKLLGQLQEKGNVDLVKYYIALFEGAFLIKTVPKYSGAIVHSKASSPKIIPLAPSLVSKKVSDSLEGQGRIFESIIGSDLLKSGLEIFYWQEGNCELDYCFEYKNKLFALEVKSSRVRPSKSLDVFLKKYPEAIPVYISHNNYESFEKSPLVFLEKFL